MRAPNTSGALPLRQDMRLVKYLSTSGVASRRAADRLVTAGRVIVNGRTVTDPAFDVSEHDRIECDGERIEPLRSNDLVYVMLHKPAGVFSTMSIGKEQGPCLADLVQIGIRLHPVGRLDMDSSGLILLTNDGDLTYRLTHPSHKVEKEYHVKTSRPLNQKDFKRLKRGVAVDGRIVEVDMIAPAKGGRLSVTIHEGRKRIIKRLFKEIGCRITELKRVRIGNVGLKKLSVGRWRYLTDSEISSLSVKV